jgi:glycosyltransferase involved in cell wall biosynthesis
VAAKKRIAATLKIFGLLPITYRLYTMQREVFAARNLQQAGVAVGAHLFSYRQVRRTRKALARAKVNLRQSRVVDGMKILASIAYGPAQFEWQRKAALNEILIFGLATADTALTAAASNHLSGAWGWRSHRVGSVLELTMSLEHYSDPQFWSDPAGYKDFIRSSTTNDEQLIYARANFGFGMPDDLFGTEVLRHMQTLWTNSLLELHGLAHLEANLDKTPLTIDDLPKVVSAAEAVEGGPKVTVLVPVFNGEEFLGTALAGLAAQTYRNIEVLVVDDASTDSTRAIVKKFAAADPRFTLVEVKDNGGSYRARNIGLEKATGEFVTVHDADDWSHPQKIERQVAALVANRKLLGTISHGIRVQHERIHFFAVAGRLFMRKNISSLMFRREPIVEAVGYWDEVRFGADSEFHERIEAKFGSSAVKVIDAGPLSFTRVHAASLTGGGYASTQTGITGIRRFYADGYKAWHADIRAGLKNARLGRASEGRPFAAPLLQHDRNGRYQKFDVVYLADLSGSRLNEVDVVLPELEGIARVGLVHVSRKTEVINDAVRSIVDFKNIALLLPGDVVTAKEVRVVNPSVLASLPNKRPEITADKVTFFNEDVEHLAELRTIAKKVFGGKN